MSTSPDPLQAAVLHHQAGRLHEAASIYRQILSANPLHADAVHLLGVVAQQQGQLDQALKLISRAIQIDGSRALYHFNLGEVCRGMNNLPLARASYRRAIALEPNAAPIWFGLAITEHSAGNSAQAVEHCRRTLSLQPDLAEAWRLLATALAACKDYDEADACFARLLALEPDNVAALMQRATLARDRRQFDLARQCFRRASELRPRELPPLLGLGDIAAAESDWPAAIAAYRAAVALDPDSALAHAQLGTALQASQQLAEAIDHYRRALALSPDYTLAHFNLGAALDELGHGDQAVESFHNALGIDPNYVDAYVNLGGHYQMLGDAPLALQHYERALAIDPNNAKAHFNRGLIWLGQGKFAEGWAEYDWRVQIPGMPVATFDLPRWTGEDIPNQTLLVHSEQGLGDTLQFLRYLSLVQPRCGRMVLLVHPPLIPFVKQLGYSDVYGQKSDLPPVDCHVPLMSLPGVFHTDLSNLPGTNPYLSIRQDLVDEWRERLNDVQGFRVGICWQGSKLLKFDHRRSFPLSALAPLAAVPGVRLISLQKTAGLEQLDELNGQFEVVDLRPRFDQEDGAFLNAAAIIENLDLVVAADTAVAHLAGGLGAPVWTALPKHADWRWLRDRDDSPWYPTMQLFRQTEAGDWAEVFDRMAERLRERVPQTTSIRAQRGAAVESSVDLAGVLAQADRSIEQGRFAQAQRHLERAIEQLPDNAELRRRAGDLQAQQTHWDQAIPHYEQAAALDPADAMTHCHWAMVLDSQGKTEQAAGRYQQSLDLAGDIDTHLEMAAAVTAIGNLPQAWRYYERVLAIAPGNMVALSTIASLGRQLDRCDEALAHLDRAIEHDPRSAPARRERGMMLLHLGDFRRGWDDYRARTQVGPRACDWIRGPQWDGAASPTTRLLVHAEQGLGDSIQFIRFLPLARRRVPNVTLVVQDALVGLFRQSGVTGVYGYSDPVPAFDCKISLMDLPYALDVTLDTLPAEVPYLSVPDDLIATWKARLAGVSGFRVGVCWQGSRAFAFDHLRSFPCSALAPLARVPGVRLVSLQKGAGVEQLETLGGSMQVVDLRPEFDQEEADFFNAAAVVKNLDLVVTADTAIAHLAGALAAPVWVASPARSDWRWLRNREDSPWYPTMRVFHQQKRRQWDELFERLAEQLASEVARRHK